ncbi:MAG: hypothetical protein GY793_12265 [Proteobacteria bacterium]|nr:hypothetical protein [Pseudomonadota bacterium]
MNFKAVFRIVLFMVVTIGIGFINYGESQAASKPEYRRAAAEYLCKAKATSKIKGTYGKKNQVSYAFDKIRRAKKYTANTKAAKKAIYSAVQFLGKRKFNLEKANEQINIALFELMHDGVKCIKGDINTINCTNGCKRR